ncbi:MAG: 2-hydroxyacyl-CoA dehydratase family protein [Verrucomicrobiota bacterium]|jgi:benzoyl-CoA reductase/2-hydroxyglutaryl-CoA dehydratase subunit BcrC/BadD/HgdB
MSKLVFYTSPWVPAEWIRAHGLEPRGVWFAEDFALESAPLAEGVCAFAQGVVRLAERQSQSAVVFTTHCDQLRRGFDAAIAQAPARLFLFNLPATWQTGVAERLFCGELERLGRFLVRLGGQPPSAENLRAVLDHYASGRRRLLQAVGSCPGRQYAEAVARFHWDGSVWLPEKGTGVSGAIALALVGGPLPRAQWRLLETLEGAGGRVVLDATEAGERSLWDTPPPGGKREGTASACDSEPALRDLAQMYLANCVDVFQRPNTRLYDWLRQRLEARGARGLVLWAHVGCDLWRAEAQSLREAFGLPLLVLDAGDAAGAWPRITSRIEAFLEALR